MPPPLPQLLTPALLTSIRSQPNLPKHAWYFVTGVTLSILNRPDEIGSVLRYALENGAGAGGSSGVNLAGGVSAGISAGGRAVVPPSREEQLLIARKMREALVKSAAIGGLPKTINALLALKPHTPASLLDAPLSYSPTNRPLEIYDVASSSILHRGQTFFDSVYGKISKRVMGQMDRCGTEDLGLTARLMYGYILSNTAVLSPAESSFVLIAGLVPQDVNPQLKGHLKGAVNNGASVEEVRAVWKVVVRICEAAGMKMLPEGEMGWGWREDVAKL